ncbi:hypothetical protein EJB05_24903 [Eragrostis curvula]|uniref:Uncharacterized protein n=1 Tax=Eragrostis curvula TaxID=38414 RepID=A0A5J9VBT2_9POAL|nr:hypothetical protein EJB05_24903 [Eragrostis curvula]
MRRPADSSVGSMDVDNLKTKQQLMEAIKKTEEKISLLLAQIAVNKKKEEISLLRLAQMADIKKKQRFMSSLFVLVACAWALFSACFMGGLRAYYILRPSTDDTSHQQCSESETVAANEATAIAYWLLCCSVLQAAAAVMALLLTGRRRALAYAALAATIVGHCMYGRIQWLLLVTYPGDDRIIPGVWLCVLALVDDLLLFVLLLVLERDAEDGAAFDSPVRAAASPATPSVRPSVVQRMHRPADSSVGSMDEDNLKTKQLLMETIKKKEEEISLLLAQMAVTKKKEEISLLLAQMADFKKKQRFLSFLLVLGVCVWALFSAYFLGGLSAYNIIRSGTATSHQQCSESESCYELTFAAADEVSALAYGLLCCSVLQSAAAVIALLLIGGRRRRHRRRALVYAALAATTVGHCMYGRIQWLLLAAYPGSDDRIIPGVWLSVIALVDDLLFFLLLILVGDYEDGGKQA